MMKANMMNKKKANNNNPPILDPLLKEPTNPVLQALLVEEVAVVAEEAVVAEAAVAEIEAETEVVSVVTEATEVIEATEVKDPKAELSVIDLKDPEKVNLRVKWSMLLSTPVKRPL
jgi:hypothetical protein